MDKIASAPAKRALSKWLETRAYDKAAVADAILQLFDGVYTTPLLTLRAFFRSLLITVLFIIVMIYVSFPSWYSVIADDFWIAAALGLFVLANLVSDYGALFIIRYYLATTRFDILEAVIIGPMLSALLITIAIIGIKFLLQRAAPADFIEAYNKLTSGILMSARVSGAVRQAGDLSIARAVLAAAFIVHIWLPSFAICVVLAKTMNWAQWFAKQGRQQPFRPVGLVAASVTFLVTAAYQMLR